MPQGEFASFWEQAFVLNKKPFDQFLKKNSEDYIRIKYLGIYNLCPDTLGGVNISFNILSLIYVKVLFTM